MARAFRQNASGRWIDSTGRFVSGARVSRAISKRSVRKRRKAAERVVERRTADKAAKLSRAGKAYQERVRAIRIAEPGLTHREAQEIEREAFGPKIRRRQQKTLEKYRRMVVKKGPRKGKLGPWVDITTGKTVSTANVRRSLGMHRYLTAVEIYAGLRKISWEQARKEIKEKYGGNWRLALDDASPRKKGKGR